MLAAVCFAGVPVGAFAAEPAPVLDDEGGDDGARLSPPAGLLGGELSAPRDPDPEPDPDPDPRAAGTGKTMVAAHARFAAVPKGIMDAFFDTSPALASVAAGISIDFDIDGHELVLELDWTRLVFPAGNWLPGGSDPVGAVYAEVDVQMISVDVTYRDHVDIVSGLTFFYGAGLGLGGLVGDIDTTEVLPNCTGNAVDCAHWRGVGKEPLQLPTRVIPIVHLTTGLQYQFGDVARVRLELGFRNVLYAGLTAGFLL